MKSIRIFFINLLFLTIFTIFIISKIKKIYYIDEFSDFKPNAIVHLDEFEQEFEIKTQTYCNSQNKDSKLEECLKSLSILDKKIQFKRSGKKIYNQCDECFTVNGQKVPIYHHTFWHLNDSPNSERFIFNRRVLFLNLMSFFFSQNLCCTKLKFWKLKIFPIEIETELIEKFSQFIKNRTFEIVEFDLNKLCEESKILNNSIIYKYPICKGRKEISYSRLISFSDLVRFVVLDLYGGIYVDGDVIYLKETNLLWKKNFVYKWSYTNKINTAIIGINKYLNLNTNGLYNMIFSRDKSLSSLISSLHPFSLSKKLQKNSNFKIYHSFLFDSAWLCFDGRIQRSNNETVCGFNEFNNRRLVNIKNYSIENFFRGAFTYHLHLVDCGLNIRNDSLFYLFENFYYKRLGLK